jgi:hypothetical protein
MDKACDSTVGDLAEDGTTNKHSYTIPCASVFRDTVDALAVRRRVNVGDIARSVLLVMPSNIIAAHDDPGDPPPDDRETVILKSGPAKGRPWRRKPRLQVRMSPGYEVTFIRRALSLALALDRGDLAVRLDDPSLRQAELAEEERRDAERRNTPPPPPHHHGGHSHALEAVNEELERMKAVISVLAFEPLPEGVRTRAEALHVLGFPPGLVPDRRSVRARFRMLATIHHPDSHYGSHHRMSQLNQAMEVLRDVG